MAIAATGTGIYFYSDYASGNLSDPITLEIPKGYGTLRIGKLLKSEGAIKSPAFFALWARKTGKDRIWQPGSFEIQANSGYEALGELLSGKAYLPDIEILIPEGLQIPEIGKRLEEAGICGKEEFVEACREFTLPIEIEEDAESMDEKDQDYAFLAGTDKPGRRKLEGYLFPDTYRFFPDTPPEEVIRTMLLNFRKKVCTKERLERAEELGISLDEAIIMGSLAESEAVTEEDRRRVAGVFYNRLSTPGYGKLQSCVTVEFAMGIHKTIISYADTQTDSPYNTYMYPGLPIGPICCPGTQSIDAALWPEENDYYFFQSDKFGRLWFAATYGEHLRYQKDIQKDWEVKTRIVGE